MAFAALPTSDGIIFDANGYGEQPERNVSSFPVDIGPALEARMSSVATEIINGTIICLTMADYESLHDFYRDDLKDGSLKFTATHPRTGVASQIFKFQSFSLSRIDGLVHFVSFSMRWFR